MEDFIPGIDIFPERKVLDFTANAYGKNVCDFCINANCCILNGRSSKKDNFTFVSTQGSSVDNIEELNNMIYSLESSVNYQTDLNNCYSVSVDLIKAEILDKLKVKEICANSAISKKRRRSKKPWWSETLTELWNSLCCAEKEMLKSPTSNCQQFWKEIGKISVGEERRKRIPMEVVREDGTTSNDMTDILQVWQDSFQTLLNSSGNNSISETQNEINGSHGSYLNEHISLAKLIRAIRSL
ncbi:Hypothetical predicted protein [Mytilus galloprovincialis]|uniref:Uncharacterized protein n=1 Tax=Mytilus galloprovincialis TaxID=29158 RepID=A0A8B6C0G8_MYTGA|nr:Hypothetical predicted protein [Mytilus galloprovincialis]